ncbi:hypothetical protein GOBAR_AA17202 [Gossypium barbadense]|uniref:Uncharacterized protein n=1 Tax=Gossypium barbadense TaxID=3634 RepID=A0A2P5XJF9_GOSBA|nr:hypothetical protein GOBAR_AA17202 [Gossypium barbadense]
MRRSCWKKRPKSKKKEESSKATKGDTHETIGGKERPTNKRAMVNCWRIFGKTHTHKRSRHSGQHPQETPSQGRSKHKRKTEEKEKREEKRGREMGRWKMKQ